jgi:membrane-bound lytic murein transglycosylase D
LVNFRFFKVLTFMVFAYSCSSFEGGSDQKAKETKTKAPASIVESAKTDFEKSIHQSDGDTRIDGSSTEITRKNQSSKIYFLYGAEHLGLKNYYFDIPVVYNAATKKWITYFLGRGKEFFIRYSERAGRYAPMLGKILEDHGVPRDMIFLAMAESGFVTHAKSHASAVGPWQFIAGTGKRYGLKINWYVDERRDPIKSTIAASKYLKKLYNDFGSWELAHAGYNAGEGKVSRAIKRYKTENFWKIRKGRYFRSETKNYVPKIMALAIIGKNLESFGFKGIEFKDPLDFDEYNVGANTDLMAFAEATGIDFEKIQELNPEIMRWLTPATVESYPLRLPVGSASKVKGCCEKMTFKASEYALYKMKSRSSLKAVARKFKLPITILTELNPIRADRRLKPGTMVTLPFRKGQKFRSKMYADLYEKRRRRRRRRRRGVGYYDRIRIAKHKGKLISNPYQYYVVRKGDTLWDVSRKTGVALNTIIRSNLRLLNGGRMIRAGDRLAIK